jgi:cytochrome c oxidase subunit 2
MLAAADAHAEAPLEYVTSHGIRAHPIQALTWAMMIVSIAVIVIISALLVASVMRGWRRQAVIIPDATVVERPLGGMSWIYIGVGVSTIVLFVMMVWTVVTLAKVSNLPSGGGAVTVEVTGHQWWWEVNYFSDDPSRQFSTANELYIPTGVPVEVRLRGADVIHSFWVPALTGKTDAIPGQNNRTWLQADHPGVFRGQCTEYCGDQHAHMGFEVVAVPPDQFTAWWNAQLQGAPPVPSLPPANAQNAFVAKCGICHTVRGTRAGGRLGPDLTHIMSRRTIAAATLPNTPGQLVAWIADPQHIKPGNFMPQLDLSGPELISIRDYVETLK